MAHDVFISYSSKDKPVADAVCAALEAERVRCWIAPRDVTPGVPYGEAIIEALNGARLLVLIFTANSNTSRHVMREVERAVNKGLPVVPFRVEDVRPTPSMEYFISSDHWLDALTPPLDGHIRKLVETVRLLRGRDAAHADARPFEPLSEHPRPGAPDGRRDLAARGERPHAEVTREHARSEPRRERQGAGPGEDTRPAAAPLPPPDSFVTTPLGGSPTAPHAPALTQPAPARAANRGPLLLVVGLAALAAVALLVGAFVFFASGDGDDPPPAEVAAASSAADGSRSTAQSAAQPDGAQGARQTRTAGAGSPSEPRLVLEGHTGQVQVCAFSPDGRLVASGGDDKTVRLWDAASGRLVQTLDGLEAAVLSLAFSPDGRLLAAGLNYDAGQTAYPLHLFELRGGRAGGIVRTLKNPNNAFSSAAFSADGRALLGGSRPAMLWDTADWSLRSESVEPGVNPAFALSPDGRLLATGGSNENEIKIWDAATGALKLTLGGHGKGVLSLAFSPDGRTLVSGSYDDTARLWDAQTGAPRLTLKEDDLSAVFSVAYAPDGATVATGSYHSVKLWDARTSALKQTLTAEGMGVTYRLAFSPDGRTLAGASDKSVKLWDVNAST